MTKIEVFLFVIAVFSQCQAAPASDLFDQLPRLGKVFSFSPDGFVSSVLGQTGTIVSGAGASGHNMQAAMVSTSRQTLDQNGKPVSKGLTHVYNNVDGQVFEKTYEN